MSADVGRGAERVREHREDLEALAESDSGVAWIAAGLLEAIEEEEGDG